MDFIMQNAGTIVVALIVAAVLAMVIVKMVKDKKKGASPCGSKCHGCANASICHKQ